MIRGLELMTSCIWARFRLELMRKLYNIVIPLNAVAVTQYNTYTTHIIYADKESSSVDTDNSLSDIESDSADLSDSPNESGSAEDKNTDNLYSYWQSLIKNQFVSAFRSYYTPNDPKALMVFDDGPKTKIIKTKKCSLDLKKNSHSRSSHSSKRYLFFPAHSVYLFLCD